MDNSIDLVKLTGCFKTVHSYTDGSVKAENVMQWKKVDDWWHESTLFTVNGNFITVRLAGAVVSKLIDEGLNTNTVVAIAGTLLTEVSRSSGLINQVVLIDEIVVQKIGVVENAEESC